MSVVPCLRSTGQPRAYFKSREAAEAFARAPENPDYWGDVAHECFRCGFFHLSRPEWLTPEWSRGMRVWN
jgi:hypothetical protein